MSAAGWAAKQSLVAQAGNQRRRHTIRAQQPSQRTGDKGSGSVESNKPTQTADKTAKKALPAAGDDTMLAIATLGVAGTTVASAGIAAGKCRDE